MASFLSLIKKPSPYSDWVEGAYLRLCKQATEVIKQATEACSPFLSILSWVMYVTTLVKINTEVRQVRISWYLFYVVRHGTLPCENVS